MTKHRGVQKCQKSGSGFQSLGKNKEGLRQQSQNWKYGRTVCPNEQIVLHPPFVFEGTLPGCCFEMASFGPEWHPFWQLVLKSESLRPSDIALPIWHPPVTLRCPCQSPLFSPRAAAVVVPAAQSTSRGDRGTEQLKQSKTRWKRREILKLANGA